ncbi:hypothetical protein MNBD_GAMMA16-2135 [hydrothermal vent metagenome]|uniref:Tetratricopeptide repeat protein n=1 Tax=hydrothermal vent metagenome TaxID=652676 RepID=A0A3B0ZJY8_9ZZZZ
MNALSSYILFLIVTLFIPIPTWGNDDSIASSLTSDTHHNNVLYYFFQKKFLTATSKSLFFEKSKRYEPENYNDNLLVGALYLSYGLFDDAKELFIKVADKSGEPALRDKAWLYLAETFYRRAEYDNALSVLNRIKQTLPSELEARKVILNANIFLFQNLYDQAAKILIDLKEEETIWADYARFNLGVALIKLQQTKQGMTVIETIASRIGTLDPEAAALRDRANIALGYTALNNQQAASARKYFERIHLHGPYSNQALFGLGQSWFIEQQPSKAIKIWMELNKRNIYGAAVLESSLVIAQAYITEKNHSQALIYLNKAINTIDSDVTLLQKTIIDIESNQLMNEIQWQWEPNNLPKALRRHTITKLMSSHQFIETLRSYRDLKYVNDQFSAWKNSIAAFETMLDTRRRGYHDKLPAILKKYETLDINKMNSRYSDLTKKIKNIEKNNDIVALKTKEEASYLKRMIAVNTRLEKISPLLSPEKAQRYKERAKRVQGLLYWKMAIDYKPRLHTAKKHLKELASEISNATRLRTALNKAQQQEPELFEQYKNRISGLSKRVKRMETEMVKIVAAQKKQINLAATTQLNKQVKQLTHYKEQAQYAIAQIYDLTVTTSNKKIKVRKIK